MGMTMYSILPVIGSFNPDEGTTTINSSGELGEINGQRLRGATDLIDQRNTSLSVTRYFNNNNSNNNSMEIENCQQEEDDISITIEELESDDSNCKIPGEDDSYEKENSEDGKLGLDRGKCFSGMEKEKVYIKEDENRELSDIEAEMQDLQTRWTELLQMTKKKKKKKTDQNGSRAVSQLQVEEDDDDEDIVDNIYQKSNLMTSSGSISEKKKSNLTNLFISS